VPESRIRALFGRRFFRHLWRLTRVYWVSPDAPTGGALLALAIAFELGVVYGNVLLARVQREMFDAMQDQQAAAFFRAVSLFLGVVLVFLFASAYRIYVRQILEIRWRRWLTDHYLRDWMQSGAYYRLQVHERETDNPDQRIAEDVRDYVASALGLSLSLLSAIATLVSFLGILWTLSGEWHFGLAGREFHIPGFMVWVALLYSGLSTWITHRVGRRLVPINFDQQRFEADFRYSLVRFRENAEAIAFSRGEEGARRTALGAFGHVVGNWLMLIRAQRNLSLVTTGLGQANGVVPFLVAAPAFFFGRLTWGAVMQANIAYGQVSSALTWFVNAYVEIARWRASLERLFSFTEAIEQTGEPERGIQFATTQDPAIRLVDLRVELPDGRMLLEGVNAAIAAGDRLVVQGPSRSCKSTIFRVLAGVWRFGLGRVELPEKGRMLFVPQRPYLPIGTLRAAIADPSPAEDFDDERVREVLRLMDLARLTERLDEVEHWEQHLSTEEQQRLALARVLLLEPDWIFLDEATSTLDEEVEERFYDLLEERLPHATVVSVAGRPGLMQFHDKRWTIAPRDGAATIEVG
jgi:putative ATP-binding cassette transporter